MTEQHAIEIKGLLKSYGRVRALRGLNLQVRQGELFGFLGPNGAGKTTTIRCLLDLIRPDGGAVRVLGIDPQANPVAVQAQTGYLPGELNLESNLRVEGALRYFGALRQNQVDWRHVRELARRLELDLGMPIRNLSKGNKQKVGVVQALMSRPRLLLLDEPTAGLDPLMQQEVYRLLKEAQAEGATVFFSSHIISEVEALAERVAIIREGIVAEEADPRQLIAMSLRRVRVRFREPVEIERLAHVEGVTVLSRRNSREARLQVEGEMDALIKALASLAVVDIETEHPSLEEVFLAYYASGKEEAEDVG
jgi:ABC-2 type transport system ATP-binding protein